jgi:hypothetical protein
MWPFTRPEKTTRTVRVLLTDDETLACAQLLDACYALRKDQDHEADVRLWQWIKRTLGEKYIPGCHVTIDTANRAQFSVVFRNAPIPKTS